MSAGHSRPFPARFDSEDCCGIEEGEMIVMVDGEAVHAECFDHDACPPYWGCRS